jgi:TolA-binding protein
MVYRQTLMDRYGARAADFYKAAFWGVPMAMLAGALAMWELSHLWMPLRMALSLLAMAAMFAFIVGGALLLSHGAGAATEAAMQHRGASTPSVADYSLEKALVMKGQIDQAIYSYERHIAEHPTRAAPYLLAADLYRGQGKAARAHALLTAARECPGVTEADLLQATNRLIDLYLGPLDRPDQARHELRYLIRSFPASQAAIHAQAALGRLSGEGL